VAASGGEFRRPGQIRLGGAEGRESSLLAGAADYVYGWLFWVAAPILIVWVAVGGLLLRRGVKPHVTRSQGRLGRCLLVASLAGVGGAVAAIVITLLVVTLGNQFHVKALVPGLLVVPLAFVGVTFAVIYASFDIPAGALVRISGVALAIPILVAVAAGGPAGWYAYNQRQAAAERQHSKVALEIIYRALMMSYRGVRPPDSLTVLVTNKILPRESLKCRRATGRAVDYFYVSADLPVTDVPRSQKLLACDFIENQRGEGRTVLFINGDVRWYARDELPALLAMPENKAFAAALSQAENSPPEKAAPPASAPAAKDKP
jgi:hypothetical protein